MINPNLTKVYLLNTPLESDYIHTLYFNSLEGQKSYFLSKKVKEYDNLTYQRKDHVIKVPEIYDNLIGCNYVMYQNASYNNKWFYAFIKDIRYISDGVSEIEIETDCIQTWLFDYTIKPSFIEREHTLDDTIGANTYPENLELGEYVCSEIINTNFGSAHPVIATTWRFNDTDKEAQDKPGSYVNGIYHGVSYYLIGDQTTAVLQYILKLFADAGKSDAIVSIFMAPDKLTKYNEISTHSSDPLHWDYLTTSGGLSWGQYKEITYLDSGEATLMLDNNTSIGSDVSTAIGKPYNNVDGYVPKNKKLFAYPYKYLLATNNAGVNAVYQYEHFKNPDDPLYCYFMTHGSLTPGCSIRTVPTDYKGVGYNFDEGLNGAKYPICSYTNDVYVNWLTQNSVNIGVDLASGVATTILGTATLLAPGAGVLSAGMAMSGLSQIGSTIGQIHQMSLIPPQAKGNLNCGDVVYSRGRCTFSFYQMTIKNEYAKIIDNYFDMFGYKVCRVKIPNIHHRARYWFTKTVDVNIDGAIPNKDLQVIKNCYNKGITFWRNGSEIGNYSLDNYISNIV